MEGKQVPMPSHAFSRLLTPPHAFSRLGMSGGQAGTHAALTLSNAITNLSVGCWSTVAELAPLPAANLIKWRQQVKW